MPYSSRNMRSGSSRLLFFITTSANARAYVPTTEAMLVPVLSAAVIAGGQLRGKRTDQYLVGIGIDVNLFAGQRDGQTCGVHGQFAASKFSGGGDFLLGREHHFADIFFRSFLDAHFLGSSFVFGSGLHASNFHIQLAQ